MRLVFGLVLPFVAACEPATPNAAAPNGDPPVTPAVSALAAPSETTTPTPDATTATPSPSTASRFPALDDSCSSDADCVLFEDEIADTPPRTYACCSGCVQRAANKNWLAQFRSFCRGFSPPSCPPIGCAMPIMRPACQAGRCVAAKTP